MDIIKIKNKITDQEIELVAKTILEEKIVVLPTDTIYGFSCLATSKKAVGRIYKIKKRPQSMPLIVLVKSYCMLHDYFFVNKRQDKYIRSIWPKTTREVHNFDIKNKKRPATFILNDREKFTKDFFVKEKGTAVRLPQDELLIKIIKKINAPLISTSLNISDQKNIKSVKNLDKYFQILPDLVVDRGVSRKTKASKIIDIRDMDNIKIIRK